MGGGGGSNPGPVSCGSWIRRPENVNLALIGKSRRPDSSPSTFEIFSFDPKTTSLSSSPLTEFAFEECDGDLFSVAVHPSGDEIVCSTTQGGCKLFELCGQELNVKLLIKELPPLKDVGPQSCLTFSVDGSKLATGGVVRTNLFSSSWNSCFFCSLLSQKHSGFILTSYYLQNGHLRILEWPSLRPILDEPSAHKSVRDMDFSLDSEFLASTSNDGSARVWKSDDGVPVTTLTRSADEKIELCRFSKDGTKPFLFCTVQKGEKAVTAVWDISNWKRIGYKRLLRKPASVMSISRDGKYLALGSKDGDVCVAEVKKMEVSHMSKRLHLGTSIKTLEFCPSERVVLTSSVEWGAVVTKLNVPADWKEWQIYVLLVSLFVASAIVFYIFYENSDSFWQFPLGRDQPARPRFDSFVGDSQSADDPFGPVDM